MSYLVYKNVHLVGVFLLLLALGAFISYALNHGAGKPPRAKLFAMTHGVGMLLTLVGGFGTLARLQIHWPLPGWVLAKILIWLILGALIALIPRQPRQAVGFWWGTILLVTAASVLALHKPW